MAVVMTALMTLQMKNTERVKEHHARTIEESKKRAEAEQKDIVKNMFLSHMSQYVFLLSLIHI